MWGWGGGGYGWRGELGPETTEWTAGLEQGFE